MSKDNGAEPDETILLLVSPEEPELTETVIALRRCVENGIEVVAATPNAMRDFVEAMKERDADSS